MIIWVSITKYIPNNMTPKEQYKLSKKGDHINNEKIPSINIAINMTMIIPHLIEKSVGVKIA